MFFMQNICNEKQIMQNICDKKTLYHYRQVTTMTGLTVFT